MHRQMMLWQHHNPAVSVSEHYTTWLTMVETIDSMYAYQFETPVHTSVQRSETHSTTDYTHYASPFNGIRTY